MHFSSVREASDEVDVAYEQTHIEDFERRRVLCEEVDSLLNKSKDKETEILGLGLVSQSQFIVKIRYFVIIAVLLYNIFTVEDLFCSLK